MHRIISPIMELILASTSPYRAALLKRLQIPFHCAAPEVDETPLPGEPPQALSRRLALAKAQAVSRQNPQALVIGSDQVACIGRQAMGKPGDKSSAAKQLMASSGNIVHFYTGLALCCPSKDIEKVTMEPFNVHFRKLSEQVIDDYLEQEQPYDCAGSFKCEGLGIALFEKMVGDDPTALEGLPLITLTSLLMGLGMPVLGGTTAKG